MKTSIRSWVRFITGLILGPLITLYLIPATNCVLAPLTGTLNCWAGIAGFTWYGLPVAAFTILVALPLIFLALRSGWKTGTQFVVSGVFVALFLACTLALLDRSLNPIAVAAGLIPLGAVAAFLFWLIAIRHNVT